MIIESWSDEIIVDNALPGNGRRLQKLNTVLISMKINIKDI